MAVPFSNTKLRVPKGFQNLIEGFAREVLRTQPENIHEFGARYFEALVKRREETGVDPAEHEAAMEDRFYNNKAFKAKTVDVGNEVHQEAATKIQTKYRQYAAKQEVDERRQELAASKIQAGFRGFKDRSKIADMKKSQIRQVRSLSEENIDVSEVLKARAKQTTLDDQQAAAKIQAGFRGFKDRQRIAELKGKKDGESNEQSGTPSSREDPEKNTHQAASIIQAGFRGMQTRKKIKDMKNTSPHPGDEVVEERTDGLEVDAEAEGEGAAEAVGDEETAQQLESFEIGEQEGGEEADAQPALEETGEEAMTTGASEEPPPEPTPSTEAAPTTADAEEAAEPAAE